MPLSDPYSSYLDRLARQRAEDELMRNRLGGAQEQIQKGLGQWNEALRVQKADTRQTEQDTAAAAERAEGLRLRKAQDAREAERAKREADEAARIAAQRPIEEARAAEDRAFTLRQRETSTADAARKAAIERIKALPPETAMGEGVDVRGFIVQTGAAGGLTPDEALGLYRDAQTARANAEDATALDARMKEAQIKKVGRVPPGGSGGASGAVGTPSSRAKALSEEQAAQKQLAELDIIIKEKPKFNTGPVMDPLQRLAGTVLPEVVYDPSEQNAWRARVQRTLNSILSDQAGANVTAGELTRQLIAQMNTTLDDATFVKVAEQLRESYLTDLRNSRARQGRPPAAAEPSTAAGLPSADEFFGG